MSAFRRIVARLMVVAATAGVVLTQLASPASASSFANFVDINGAGVHTGRSNTYSALEVNNSGRQLTQFCGGTGQNLAGYVQWGLVYDPTSKVAGWTNVHWLQFETTGVLCEFADNDGYPVGGASQSGAGIHTCRINTCSIQGLANGHTLIAFCYTSGQTLGGNPLWDLVYDVTADVAGWTNEAWLSNDATVVC